MSDVFGAGKMTPENNTIQKQTFPVQDSTLSSEALVKCVLTRYPLPEPVVCRFHRKGICDTYRVMAEGKEFYLKVYKSFRRTQLDVCEEVRLLNYLSGNGISIAKPIRRQDGLYVTEIAAPEGIRYAVLFESAYGVAGDDGDVNRIKALGETVGRMHLCADKLDTPYQRSHLDMRHLIDENLKVIAPLMKHRASDFSVINMIAKKCKKHITQLLSTQKPYYGICHGDLHGGDVCYDENNNPTLFDFDSSGCGWRALDIGVFLASDDWMDITPNAESGRQHRLNSFLAGYSKIRELTQPELEAVQLTPPIRHIFLMGHVLRYTAVYEGDHWANDHFIDWHMAWYKNWAEHHLL